MIAEDRKGAAQNRPAPKGRPIFGRLLRCSSLTDFSSPIGSGLRQSIVRDYDSRRPQRRSPKSASPEGEAHLWPSASLLLTYRLFKSDRKRAEAKHSQRL